MIAPLETKTAALTGVRSDGMSNRALATKTYQYFAASATELQTAAVSDAVRNTRLAKAALQKAVYRLDDAGFICEALVYLHADAAALVAEWAGRTVPSVDADEVADWIAHAASDWRRQNRRSY